MCCGAKADNNTTNIWWERSLVVFSNSLTTSSFEVVSGGCFTTRNDSCIHSPGWPANYGADERCVMFVTAAGWLVLETFYAAGFQGVDGLRVEGDLFSSTGDGLGGLKVNRGDIISWVTGDRGPEVQFTNRDYARMNSTPGKAGFSICITGMSSRVSAIHVTRRPPTTCT